MEVNSFLWTKQRKIIAIGHQKMFERQMQLYHKNIYVLKINNKDEN